MCFPMAEEKICEKCGFVNNKEDKFCVKCGALLPKSVEMPPMD